MNTEKEIEQWISTIFWSQSGSVYVRLYKDVPEGIWNLLKTRFGHEAIVARSELCSPNAA